MTKEEETILSETFEKARARIEELESELREVKSAPHSVHPLTEKPRPFGDPEQNLSRKVVIDLNGRKQDFVIGWYDFDSNNWTFDHDDISMLEIKHAVWMEHFTHLTKFIDHCVGVGRIIRVW